MTPPRLAVRGILVVADRLLLVNAYPGRQSDLWCAPGGGVERGASLPDNLRREIAEETGLSVTVGAPCLVNEFHDPAHGFHQVELFFRCRLEGGEGAAPPAVHPPGWADPDGVVNRYLWAARDDLARIRLKPDSLARIAFARGIAYDPLETIVT